jgi:hypothetical protein
VAVVNHRRRRWNRAESLILVHEPDPGELHEGGNKMQAMCRKDLHLQLADVGFLPSIHPSSPFVVLFVYIQGMMVFWGDDNCVQSFKCRDNVLLKWIFKKLGVRVWTGFNRLISTKATALQKVHKMTQNGNIILSPPVNVRLQKKNY